MKGIGPSDTKLGSRAPTAAFVGQSVTPVNAKDVDMDLKEDDITWFDVARALDWASFLLTTFFNFFTTFMFALILLIGSAVNEPSLELEVVRNETDLWWYGTNLVFC